MCVWMCACIYAVGGAHRLQFSLYFASELELEIIGRMLWYTHTQRPTTRTARTHTKAHKYHLAERHKPSTAQTHTKYGTQMHPVTMGFQSYARV